MPCMSIHFDPVLGPIANIGIAPSGSLAARAGERPVLRVYSGLIDTGASGTCISSKVAEEVGLVPIGKTPVTSATHEAEPMNTYLVDLAMPFGDIASAPLMAASANLQVTEFNAGSADFEILIGRDVICAGLFSMAGYDKRFTFCL